MDRLLNVVTGISVLLALLVLISVRRSRIRVEYSVSWLAASALLLLLSLSEPVLQWMGQQIGITYPPMVLLVLAGSLFIAVFYVFSVRLSGLRDTNIELTQKLAILEYRIRKIYEEQQN